jgi:8-oxo-dGTP pyrophosphatase MutT (NUDIX family)
MGKKVAGCVPVKKGEDGEWKVLMVQSRFKPEIWLFPKGGIEKKEKNWEAACRETVEEAGVSGKILCKLGKWKGSNDQKLIMYLLLVEQELTKNDTRWKERNERPRRWLTFDEAEKTILQVDSGIRRPELLEMLLLAKARILTLDTNPESYSTDSSPEEENNEKEF